MGCTHPAGVPVLCAAFGDGLLQAFALYNTHQYYDDGDDQENMNKSAHGVRGNKSQKPEDDEDDGNGFEHFVLPFANCWQVVNGSLRRLMSNVTGARLRCVCDAFAMRLQV